MKGNRLTQTLCPAPSPASREPGPEEGLRCTARFTGLLGVLLLLLAAPGGPPNASATAPALASLAGLPLCFEANQGQAGPDAQFVARSRSGTFVLSSAEATVTLTTSAPAPKDPRAQVGERLHNRRAATRTLSLQFLGANPRAAMNGQGVLSGKVNYFLGSDPAHWRTDLPLFERVCVAELYPGIELVYYGNQQKLEYDFIVAPGADVDAICLRVTGADRLELDAQGDLVLSLGEAQLRQHKPVFHQVIGGVCQPVTGGYRLQDQQTVAFQIGSYDPQVPLTIDPVLTYSSYLGGSGTDTGWDIAVDGAGSIYVAGETLSANLPATAGAFQTNYAGGYFGAGGDAFVAKFDSTCSNLVYLTYLGGKGDDAAMALALDATGNVYLTGVTDSPDFPVTNAIRSVLTGTPSTVYGLRPFDAFVTKLNTNGSALVYSTYIGGDGEDEGTGIAVDPAGSAYLTGLTSSTNFPAVNPLQTNLAGSYDAFVAKLGPAGTNFIYSTCLGGTNWDQGNSIAVDGLGRAFVTGLTSSTNFPTTNALQPWLAGGYDAFVAVIGANGTDLVRSTYLGSAGDDSGQRIRLDAAGNAYITGTYSPLVNTLGSFPITPGNLNPGGVFISSDAGASWSPSTAGLLHPYIYSLALDPAVPNRVYAGTGRGVARSTDGGLSWDTAIAAPPAAGDLAPAIAVGPVYALAVSSNTPSVLYAGTVVGVYKSLDAGTNWSLSSTGLLSTYPGSQVNTLVPDPSNSSTLYAGTGSGVFRSTNAAANWASLNSWLGSVSVLAFDPTAPATLYAATYGNGVYRSTNRGTNWTVFNNGLTNQYCLSLAIDPQSPSTLYAGTSDGLFQTTNRGTNWHLLSLSLGYTNGLSVLALAFDPTASHTIYAGTTNGLFRSADGGTSWSVFTNGIPREMISCLVTSSANPTGVYAGAAPVFFFSTNFLAKLDANTGAVLFSTVLGGNGLAVDSLGNSYVVSTTTSTNFPTVGAYGSLSATNQGSNDVLVTVISPDASALLYSVYLGGSSDDYGLNIAVDPTGNAYVVGRTSSTNFPTFPNNAAFQSSLAGGSDAFIARIESRPLLVATLAGSNVQLKWPAFPPPLYALETASTLSGASWTPVPQPPVPVIVNGWYTVTLPADSARGFFRLRRL